jgi:hypothetical protein
MVLGALTALFAVTGFASEVPLAEVMFLVSASLGAVMLFFAMAMPSQAPAPIPVRVRRR